MPRYTLNQRLAICMIGAVLVVGFLGVFQIGVTSAFPATEILGGAITLLTAQQIVKQANNRSSDTDSGDSDHD